MRKKKRNKKIVLLIVVIFALTLIGTGLYFVLEKGNITKPNYDDYYSEYVITNKESKIYIKDNDEYRETGLIGKNIELSLNNENSNDGYFNIAYFDSKYYIYYEDVNKIDELSEIDDRYGVEFNNRLLYIKASDGEVTSNTNTDKHNASGIGVFNYHAFYDENDPNDSCPTVICHSKKQFKEQLDYLKENNILTLKMKEVEMYIDGKIQLPKSILLTIDDGGRDKIAVDMLTEYKMYATIFLVTSWYDPSTYYKTDYIEFHSHTDDMHDTGVCPGGQGGGIKCLSEEVIQNDLKASREKLGGSTYMAYPFYEYNDYSIKMLKEAGFTMAFIGESNNSDNLVHVGSDKFRLRRFVIADITTIDGLTRYFDQIK